MDQIAEQEALNWEACNKCAKNNGYSIEEAEMCNAGDLECKGCPFR